MLLRLLALAGALVVLAPATVSASALTGMSGREGALLAAMNEVRREHGLQPLRLDVRLERAARAHTREMLARNVFAHGAFALRLRRFDVKAHVAGENLAWGSGALGAARSIVAAWLASPGHRANLLAPSFTRVGVGDLVGAFLGNRGAHVVTADFAG